MTDLDANGPDVPEPKPKARTVTALAGELEALARHLESGQELTTAERQAAARRLDAAAGYIRDHTPDMDRARHAVSRDRMADALAERIRESLEDEGLRGTRSPYGRWRRFLAFRHPYARTGYVTG